MFCVPALRVPYRQRIGPLRPVRVYRPITDYDVAVPIPTDLTLPCYGSSQATFVPLPQYPGVSRDAIVPVEHFATCPSRICPV
jgi:hypothetical protein